MITYEYICSACSFVYEVQQSPKKFKKLKTCPNCKEKTLEQQFFSPHFSVSKEPTTLQAQAESNTKKMGKLELEAKRRFDKKQQMQMKYASHVQRGTIDADQADDIIEKTLDKPKDNALELDKDTRKKLSTGTKEEKQKKTTDYILKGKI